VRPRRTLTGMGTTRAWVVVLACFGGRAWRHGQAVGALRGVPPTPEARGNTADARGLANAGNSHRRARALAMAWGWRRFQPARALPPGAQPRCGHGRSRRRRRGMVARARPRLMAWWRCVETGVLPAGAALNAAGRLSPPRWSTGCETGLGGGAREETGCAGRTDRAQGRPTTARSRRHERRLEQVVGGKRPTRIEGGLRRLRLTPASALSTVAARRDARKRLPSAPT
jgi:hypothetical protein